MSIVVLKRHTITERTGITQETRVSTVDGARHKGVQPPGITRYFPDPPDGRGPVPLVGVGRV